MKRKYALAALTLAAASAQHPPPMPRNALATRCNRTIRLGVYRIASPEITSPPPFDPPIATYCFPYYL